MPAAIFGDRFFGKREKAWHNIGTVLDEELTATEAVRIADIAFPIAKWPVWAQSPEDDTLIETPNYAVVSVEEAISCTDLEEQSVKEVNAKIKNFFNKTGSA